MMASTWPRAATVAMLACIACGCTPIYRPPTASQPHATVKIRRVFEKSAGTQLNEHALVNGHRAESATAPVELAEAPRASAILVHPTPAKLVIGGGFSHWETRSVQESYTQQVPYTTTESYSCGSGTSYRTCTRTVTRYRSDLRYRTVLKNVEVPDGKCAASVTLAPRDRHLYVLDYTYRDDEVCSVACLEQVAIMSDGSFKSAPCPEPTAEELRAIERMNED